LPRKYESIEEWIENGKKLESLGIFFLMFGMLIFIVSQWKIGLIIAILGLAITILTEYSKSTHKDWRSIIQLKSGEKILREVGEHKLSSSLEILQKSESRDRAYFYRGFLVFTNERIIFPIFHTRSYFFFKRIDGYADYLTLPYEGIVTKVVLPVEVIHTPSLPFPRRVDVLCIYYKKSSRSKRAL
jgi:hypothetical protein